MVTSPTFIQSRRGVALMLACALLAACDNPPDDGSDEAIRQRLVGSWAREYEEEGVQVQRLLVMEADGNFHEISRAVGAGGKTVERSGEGIWTYDGTNLKRKYTRFDGKQPSAPTVPFATFEITKLSRHEFAGRDNLRRLEVHYRRVADTTTGLP